MDLTANEPTVSSPVSAGVLIALLAVFGATMWFIYRQRRTGRTQKLQSPDGDAVFKVPPSPTARTFKEAPNQETDVQEDTECDNDHTDIFSKIYSTMKTLLIGSLLLAVLCVCESVTFGQLCSGNPSNSRRTRDNKGQGHYGAPRTHGTHQGLDIRCSDGATVYAPFDVMLRGKLIVYNDPTGAKAAINKGINLRGEGLCFKLFYVDPIQTTGTIRKGQKIGTMLPMQSVYPGITSHVHVQMCDKSDPTPFF